MLDDKLEITMSTKLNFCGESGIRTHGTLLGYTRFPSVLLQPLGHLSGLIITYFLLRLCFIFPEKYFLNFRFRDLSKRACKDKKLHQSANRFLRKENGFVDTYIVLSKII